MWQKIREVDSKHVFNGGNYFKNWLWFLQKFSVAEEVENKFLLLI